MTNDEADTFLMEGIKRLRPLIDDLAKEIGESPEAWRGISVVLNGMSSIMLRLGMSDEMDPASQIATMAILVAAIVDHPALRAAEAHWRCP